MVIAPHLIPDWLNVFLGTWLASCFTIAMVKANWGLLNAAPQRQHVLLGGLVAMLLLWLLTFRVIDEVWLHLLGISSLTLIVGWRFTIIGATLVLTAYLLIQGHALRALPLAWMLTVFIPASVTRLLGLLLRHYGMKNLFVYQLGAGFGGGLVSIFCVGLACLPLFWLLGQNEWLDQAWQNWPFIFLVMFPEGFINGMLVTAFTTFFPDAVKTFDDAFYLDGKD